MTNPPYDLLPRGGHVIDPASDLDGVADLAIRDGQRHDAAAPILPEVRAT